MFDRSVDLCSMDFVYEIRVVKDSLCHSVNSLCVCVSVDRAEIGSNEPRKERASARFAELEGKWSVGLKDGS